MELCEVEEKHFFASRLRQEEQLCAVCWRTMICLSAVCLMSPHHK